MHSHRICHRDVKLENLLLDRNLSVVIADFGSAAICKSVSNKPIEFDSSIIVGSKEYNSPELNMEKNYFGEKADIFSAGVCLFLLVVGNPPFRIANTYDPHYTRLS